MFTHSYKGYWIHGYCDRDECRVQCPDYSILGTFKSYRAAQLAITRRLFRVHIGYTISGRERFKRFATMESARAFCNEVFARSKIVLSIVQA